MSEKAFTEKRRTRNPTTYLAKSFAEFGTRLSLAFGTNGFGHCYQEDKNKRNESTIERDVRCPANATR
jgi:hypothetical protein